MNFGDSGSNPEDIAFFMESIFLKKFKRNVGQTVHSLNTVCVGLDYVRSGKAKKPAELDVRWKPANVVLSSEIARLYVVRAAHIFVTSSFKEYLKDIKLVFDFSADEQKISDTAELIDLFESKIALDVEKYRWIFLKLLVHNRNHIIHGSSRARLTSCERDELNVQRDNIFNNHHHLDVIKMLEHVNAQSYTLKEISTLATNAIYIANQLDACFQKRVNSVYRIINVIKNTSLKESWENLCRSGNKEHWENKKRTFLNMNFPFIDDPDLISSFCSIDDKTLESSFP